ncbi:hypothetical protein M3P05_13460 [Sansalvadorimonas sp. 2012CJ34-2]|uniref:Uncharacterized protein n=1 Tax=Parendozoicomonas callyspongiae TaxID=2942213 RepID=A0ABT0PHR8_9GAMM|nr:hypothetical protein [Sansalvadorimonas sp. 2012CJ34-2]MCL6270932.1 hypothetical protein [Sansalvadorimonas sp. 2012CJ34-2]
MPAPASTSPTSAITAGISSDKASNPEITVVGTIGKMGRREVSQLNPSQLTTGLLGAGQKSMPLNQRHASSITSPVGLSLTDQSNLTALSNMEPLQICQGILSIEGFDELRALSQLLINTSHRDNADISKIISYQLTQLENQTDVD